MKRLLTLCALTLLGTSAALAALKEGAPAPLFSAPASLAGKAFDYSLQKALEKGPVVVYFYPSAYTNGCNLQAHTFAERHDEFTAAGASIVGVSLDSIGRLNDFSADPQYCAGKLAVASDADGRIAKAYELAVRDAVVGRKDTRGNEIDHGFAERTTFVVRPDGRIAATVGGVSPVDNVAAALEAVRRLAVSAQR
jgi:peroxiredoxin